jgi:hypothetical protein
VSGSSHALRVNLPTIMTAKTIPVPGGVTNRSPDAGPMPVDVSAGSRAAVRPSFLAGGATAHFRAEGPDPNLRFARLQRKSGVATPAAREHARGRHFG